MVAIAYKLCQGAAARDIQAGQLSGHAVKLCYIASDGDRLAGEGEGVGVVVRSLLSPLNGDVAIGLDTQADFLPDSSGGGHGDDALGKEGGGCEERAEDDEEPNA